MKRRDFIGLVGGAIALPTGVGRSAAERRTSQGRHSHAFSKREFRCIDGGLRKAGYIDGQNLLMELRFHGASSRAVDEFASELVALKSTVILAATPYAIRAAMKATDTVPIIGIDLEDDPVANGWAQSLARPGGNLTGFFLDIPELGGKLIELTREVVPTASNLAVLWDTAIGATQFHATELAARAAGVTLSPLPVRRAEEISEALDSAVSQGAHALVVLSSPLIDQQRSQIVDFARQNRLPTVSLGTSFPRVGGLVAYGPKNVASMFMQAANYIDRVLSGTKPGDLPIERPGRFDLVINLKTAEALGLTIPPSILDLANEVIA